MSETKLFDLTKTNFALEMYREQGEPSVNPITDPAFRRHVSNVTTADQRKSNAERLRPRLRQASSDRERAA